MKLPTFWYRTKVKGNPVHVLGPEEYTFFGRFNDGRWTVKRNLRKYEPRHRWTLYDGGKRVARGKTLRLMIARWVEKRLEGSA